MKKLSFKGLGRSIVMLICVVGLVTVFTAGCLQDLMTPNHINPDAIKYSGQEATSYVPWTTVFDAERIKAYMDFEHLDTQKFYDELKAQDSRQYDFLTGRIDIGIADARRLQQKLFNPNGSVGMVITALFGTTIGALFINTGKKKV